MLEGYGVRLKAGLRHETQMTLAAPTAMPEMVKPTSSVIQSLRDVTTTAAALFLMLMILP